VSGPGADLAAAAASILAAAGAVLVWKSAEGPTRRRPARERSRRSRRLVMGPAGRLGLGGRIGPAWEGRSSLTAELVSWVAAAVALGVAGGWLLFEAVVPAVGVGAFVGSFPVLARRRRAAEQREAAAEAWPRILEEIRMRTGSLGRSVPQALFEAGRSAPAVWMPAFRAAEREWLLTTDLDRTFDLLCQRLDDPTADVVCELLLTAQEVGGTDLDARLAELIEDRVVEVEGRRDARSRMAGVRFARRFVLLVPAGMAMVGISVGTGRHAYSTPGGQIAVMAGIASVAACWWWSSRLMRVPTPARPFRLGSRR
jgi:tight adherence protein B